MINSTKYFSWGDIRGQNKNGSGSYSFSRTNYNAGKCGKGHTLTGDIPQGNATYDAATANMGSPWKMPTKAQAQEMINGTTYTWTALNGVNGGKFTSKKDSSKYIFLPAGGQWGDTTLYYRDSIARYWITKWYERNYAYIIYFTSDKHTIAEGNDCPYGFSVRAIQ